MPTDPNPDYNHLPQADDPEPRRVQISGRIVVPAINKSAEVAPVALSEPGSGPATSKRKIRLKLPVPVRTDTPGPPHATGESSAPPAGPAAANDERALDATTKLAPPPSSGSDEKIQDASIDSNEGTIKIFVHENASEPGPLTRREKFQQFWEKIGGRSLTLSVAIHAVILIIAGFVVFNYTQNERIDFMPGGGTRQGDAASKALEQTVTKKRTPWMNRKLPMQRIAVEKSMSEIKLPEASPALLDLPMTKDFLGAGKMGSMGFGSAGAGGGFGNGIGTGGKSGVTFGPIMMFGKQINAKRIAVVLDVSRSMTPYLEKVVNELDRVARGSTVVLYYGCGLMRPDGRIDETVQRTQSKDFERFWRIWQGDGMLGFSGQDLKKITFPPGEPIPLEDLYQFLSRRVGTYFLDYNGMDFAWSALLCNEVRGADAVYWFSDFEDDVDNRQMKTLAENMRMRRQRLFIHPQIHGSSFNEVRDQVVKITGGEVVEPDDKNKVR